MPRPETDVKLMLAVMAPPVIYHCARKGYHIQTTPLGADHSVLLEQVNAFKRGKAEAPNAPENRLSLQRGLYLARNDADAREKLEYAYEYYKRFDNVFTGPGIVDNGFIRSLPRKQTIEELGENLIICGKDEMIDRLSVYKEVGIDEVIATSIYGQSQEDTLEMMQRLSSDVFPHLVSQPQVSVA